MSGVDPNPWCCRWQATVAGLLYRHSGCRAGQRNALRGSMPASNPTSRAAERRSLADVQRALDDTRARAAGKLVAALLEKR